MRSTSGSTRCRIALQTISRTRSHREGLSFMPLKSAAELFIQGRDEELLDIPCYSDGPSRIRITHIVHLFRSTASAWAQNQNLVLEAMRRARSYAAGEVPVRCVCVTFPEDSDLIPADFIAARPLSRTV